MTLEYQHVDVFTQRPYAGNSLAVFPDARELSTYQMLEIAKELRHFETIFLERTNAMHVVRARVFDLFEELPFAGHPVIGAAAVLHHSIDEPDRHSWRVELPRKTVTVATERTPSGYFGVVNQGTPEFLGMVSAAAWIPSAFGLEPDDLQRELPLEIVSTGLRYLIVPVVSGALERARITRDLTEPLSALGAQYAVLLDESALEIRHWNNDGVMEDAATGSAAGAIGAYRLRHGRATSGETFVLHQGRFVGRPSTLRVAPWGARDCVDHVSVGGDVALVGRGVLEVRP